MEAMECGCGEAGHRSGSRLAGGRDAVLRKVEETKPSEQGRGVCRSPWLGPRSTVSFRWGQPLKDAGSTAVGETERGGYQSRLMMEEKNGGGKRMVSRFEVLVRIWLPAGKV